MCGHRAAPGSIVNGEEDIFTMNDDNDNGFYHQYINGLIIDILPEIYCFFDMTQGLHCSDK